MKNAALLPLALSLLASPAFAQGAAPEMFGVREVIVDYARFTDPKASDACGLTREEVSRVMAKALTGSGVPAIPVAEAKPLSLGVARIELMPQIASHAGDNLDCISWVTLAAENRANVVVPPVPTLRGVTIVYWRQQSMVSSSQSQHAPATDDVLEKMAGQFAQQYRLDQPSSAPQ
ncbi:MAG: hypothetical protein P4M15_15240 [Alphaproteobacteria bacterium]|nr:hypothetical protein [Alphaproteobacteria bacterium]